MNQLGLRRGDSVAVSNGYWTKKAEIIATQVEGSNKGRRDHVKIKLVESGEERIVSAREVKMFWHQYEQELEGQKLWSEYRDFVRSQEEKRKVLNKAFLNTLIPEADALNESSRFCTIQFKSKDLMYKFLNRLMLQQGTGPISFPIELSNVTFDQWLELRAERLIKQGFADSKELTA